MKKFFVMGLGLSAVFAMTSCKSSESAYKKAYEKAKQQQGVATAQEPTPKQTTPHERQDDHSGGSDACYSLDNNLHGH